ncbi:MAG: 2'-deoxycytidine 5'-triphosphate deaminase, partial [Rhodospirillaceae bacterium]|nr:2'-deoxycytidine 5'-triphosphate deaminase [Rhodospirillaceae bacterium]
MIPGLITDDSPDEGFTTGVLPSQRIHDLVGNDVLLDGPLDDDQIQPSSIDLRLGDIAWRVRSSFLPGPKSTVEGKLRDLGMHQINL